MLGKKIILPPEIKNDRTWIKEKTFSYIAGISILFKLDSEKLLSLYYSNELYKKEHYERFVREQKISNILKETILNLINPIPSMRLTMYEALSKLKDGSRNTVSRDIKNKGVQIVYIDNLKKFRMEYRKISNVTGKLIFWKQLEKIVISHRTPSDNYKKILQINKTKFEAIDEKSSVTDTIVKLLNEKIKKKQTELLVLIIDNSIETMEKKLKDLLTFFKTVLLFSKKNPFNLRNIQHKNLDTFMIQKIWEKPQKRKY